MEIFPFRGILYDKKKIKFPAKVYAPPYDIISENEQEEFYKKSPYNVIRLELNKKTAGDNEQNNIYTRAAGFLNSWIDEGVLKQDEAPAIYVYGQSFTPLEKTANSTRRVSLTGFMHNKKMRNTLGFIAANKIALQRHSQVKPHEKTFIAPKQDREKVLEIVKANLSCIYALVEDSGLKINRLLKSVSKHKAFIDVKLAGVRHRIWKLQNPDEIKKLQKLMSRKNAFIADGHHRYEAAANFRDKIAPADKNLNDEHPANYIMMYFTSIEDRNLAILATHRVVKDLDASIISGLPRHFVITPVLNKKKMLEMLDEHFGKGHVFGMYTGGKFSVLKLKKGTAPFFSSTNTTVKKGRCPLFLDVSILHDLVLKGVRDIFYTRDADEAVMMVNKKGYKAAFFLNPTLASQIKTISLAGEKMPHKSTYFYPKLLTGLVMRKLDD